MTLKDLRKIAVEKQGIISQQPTVLFERVRSKPFWIWDVEQHKQEDIMTKGDCCFQHIIGLPKKDSVEKPMFDYEQILFTALFPSQLDPSKNDFKNKHLWVKKATGLGITEFMLRLMAWLCLKDDNYRNCQMVIVTGPNIDISVKLIRRMKQLFDPISFDSKETVIELNGVTIEAYPSNHLDAYRALDKPKFILLDEADFFRKGEQEDVRNVSERYIAKSDPFIVMISTPNAPGGLFEAIEKEHEETCIYKRIKLDYTYGLDRIYARQEIEKAKTSPSFEREYNLKYLGRIGNVFHTRDIEKAISMPYDPEYVNPMAVKSMGIDPAWGSSAFGIVITQFVNGKIQVLYAEEFERPDYNQMLQKTWELICKYDPTKIWIDGANPSFIRSLKINIGGNEEVEYEQAIARYKLMKIDYGQNMRVIPVNFNAEHKAMLGHTKMLLEDELIAINSRFGKLITSMRTAVDNEGKLDKEATSYDDIFDAFRLSLHMYQFE